MHDQTQKLAVLINFINRSHLDRSTWFTFWFWKSSKSAGLSLWSFWWTDKLSYSWILPSSPMSSRIFGTWTFWNSSLSFSQFYAAFSSTSISLPITRPFFYRPCTLNTFAGFLLKLISFLVGRMNKTQWTKKLQNDPQLAFYLTRLLLELFHLLPEWNSSCVYTLYCNASA